MVRVARRAVESRAVTELPECAPPAAGTDDECRRVGHFGVALFARAAIGTALWLLLHRSVMMTSILVATCWVPWAMVRAGARVVRADRGRARGHILNASAIVFLATAVWTVWGLVLAGRGKNVDGAALAVLWTFLCLCFALDYWLVRWGLRALPPQTPAGRGVTAAEAARFPAG